MRTTARLLSAMERIKARNSRSLRASICPSMASPFFSRRFQTLIDTRVLIGTDVFMYGTLTAGVAMNYTIDGTTRRPAVLSSSAKVGQVGLVLYLFRG